MNWYSIFYWVTRADSVKTFFDVASNIFTTFTIIGFIGLAITAIGKNGTISDKKLTNKEEDKLDPDYRSWAKVHTQFAILFYVNLALALITWAGYMFTPTKKETLLIIAGGGTMQFLTTDSAAKQIPHELSTFVVTELKSMAKDAKVDLGIATQKDKILEEAKSMTTEQVLQRMKIDTNFAKIVLEK